MALRETYLVDNSLDGRLYPVISDLIDTADSMTANMQAVQSVASGAQTRADNAAADANNAAAVANVAINRLEGDDHFFYGEYSFTGQPNNLIVPYFASIVRNGIDYSAGFFNFPYLGVYAVQTILTGDCVNSRTDWYMEVTTILRPNNNPASDIFCSGVRLPPSGTWNQQQSGVALVNVKAGDKWRPIINMTPNGTTSNGRLKVFVKKVV